MTATTNEFTPNYIISPGEILEETLDARGLKKREFADRCGRSAKTISQIITGDAPISPDTAIAFERVLGVSAALWNSLESRYRLQLAKQEERQRLAAQEQWAMQFPVSKMVKFGLLKKATGGELVEQLLDFFSTGSVEAWESMFLRQQQAVAFRASQVFLSHPHAVAAWLRWGERDAEGVETAPFNKDAFQQALDEIRGLTRLPAKDFQEPLHELCRKAGVVVLWRPELDGTRLSGAAKWLSKDKVLIQLSIRHKTDDHFWFSFFHEAGHILLHGKKDVFIDEASNSATPEEQEANNFAQERLIPRREWRMFVAARKFSAAAVNAFAARIGIAPGIVVGQLQHNKHIPYRYLNGLKRTFSWVEKKYN
ncbi:MAG: hypothetical protein VR70_02020 [Rhodospirillaceae bacterium BRH_c57]|nr:MAG: hypothetical protein VR70_02020 [Rhodospirillaceae bacterium BRH_c57]